MKLRLNRIVVCAAGAMALAGLMATAHAQDAAPLYKVVDGYKVDAETMKGFRTWRAAACCRPAGARSSRGSTPKQQVCCRR